MSQSKHLGDNSPQVRLIALANTRTRNANAIGEYVTYIPRLWFILGALLISFSALATDTHIVHQLTVKLTPELHAVSVTDTLRIPSQYASDEFVLHGALNIEQAIPSVTMTAQGSEQGVPWKRYRPNTAPIDGKLTLKYSGTIHHAVAGDDLADASVIVDSAGIIDSNGVFLANSSLWYPHYSGRLISFDLTVSVPNTWQAVSQGALLKTHVDGNATTIQWAEDAPQDDLYLLAGPMTLYRQTTPTVDAQVYLRNADPALAQGYLDATDQFVAFYSKLLGAYPYEKFALVENFWETGFGMPSFTALGSQVIRLPFIIYSSYPHEILHNWWGNGVYVDYTQGNWSEGLTAYLADHLLKEQRGQGADDRRAALQKYADYVQESREFPLREFVSRHSSSSEAVGYSKALMVFHMLRRQLGDDAFVAGLRAFYQRFKFERASWNDFFETMDTVYKSGRLDKFRDQWISRAGAPELALVDVKVVAEKSGHKIEFTLAQQQGGAPYALDVPIAISLEGESVARGQTVALTASKQTFELQFDKAPLHIAVDPQFDVFRRLNSAEIPPAVSQGFGAQRAVVVLPPKSDSLYDAWRSAARQWAGAAEGQWEVIEYDDNALTSEMVKEAQAVWLFGGANNLTQTVETALSKTPFGVDSAQLVLPEGKYPVDSHGFLVAVGYSEGGSKTLLQLSAPTADAIRGLIRKIPHYRRYSYLVFEGESLQNLVKGQWPVFDSPLSHRFKPDATALPAMQRTALSP